LNLLIDGPRGGGQRLAPWHPPGGKFTILGSISTLSLPTPWPKLNPTQFWFSTSCCAYFTEIFSIWYLFNEELGAYVKILPLTIGALFTDVSLAFAIIGDGYWDKHGRTVCICTDNFTEAEVQILVALFASKFGLIATKYRRVQPNGTVCFRIRFSSKAENLALLRRTVLPYMHSSMLYKLGI
jgi:hypothetical protein